MLRGKTSDGPVKVAILVDDNRELEQWEFALLDRIAQHPQIALLGVLVGASADRVERPSLPFRLLTFFERRLFGRTKSVSLDQALSNHPAVRLISVADRGEHFDVVISHLTGPAPDDLVDQCDELWEYSFNLPEFGQPEAFAFRECLEAEPITRTALSRRTSQRPQEIFATCSTSTKFSAAFNAEYAKGLVPSLVERELLGLRHAVPQSRTPNLASAQIGRGFSPGLVACTTYVARLSARVLHRAANAVLAKVGGEPQNWSLVVGRGDVLSSSFDTITELPQPHGEFRADPFLFEKDGETFVFFESCARKDGIGRIHVGRMEDNRLVDVSPLDFGAIHNSYPYVFEHAGEVYMIPETYQRDRVEVWRCTAFPNRWELHATALEGTSPADTVLIEWDGQYWLFTNLSAGSFTDHCAELHLYRVDGPDLKSVEPHPLNPVVLDTTSARNGGRPFVRDGKLIRPAQINSHGLYGYGLAFLEVEELSMEAYRETELRRIEPEMTRSTTGCHHFDFAKDMFIMDVRRAYGSKFLGARPIAVKAT